MDKTEVTKEQAGFENANARSLGLDPPINVPFPPCTDVLLALLTGAPTGSDEDDPERYFMEYFAWGSEMLSIPNSSLSPPHSCPAIEHVGWRLCHCLPPTCARVKGRRGLDPLTTSGIQRIYVADAVWLFYFERMGIFRMLGVILDDFATKGLIPIPVEDREDNLAAVVAIILEAMVRQMKTGLGSTIKDRDSAYRKAMGWTSEQGRRVGSEALLNREWNAAFHQFISDALGYYKDKRLAVAIQSTASGHPPSEATKVTIAETLVLLKKASLPFQYGRVYYNTLSGIVWMIAALALVNGLSKRLGVPRRGSLSQYFSDALDTLVHGQKTSLGTDRFLLHRKCAVYGRNLLLKVESLPEPVPVSVLLETWLDSVESSVEGYRTSYKALTGVDLGAPNSAIEQAV